MPTNEGAYKSTEVRQRQPKEVSLSQDSETAKSSAPVIDNAKDGRADDNKGKGKRRTRRGGRKRFKKNRENANDIHVDLKDDHTVNAVADDARHANTGQGKPRVNKNKRQNSKIDKPKTGQRTNNSQSSHSKPQSKTFRKNEMSLGGIYSAIDLGTNNCRLLIAKPTKHGFRVIDAFSRIVRLGEGIGKDNRLSDEAMDRTIEALKVCSEKLARRGVTCMRHVATEACRVADNSAEFVARVKRETGINLDVISAGEEARLAVLGCQSLIAGDKRNALVFDIGGGSTELIWVKVRPGKQVEIKGWVSVPWGVVNLTEAYAKPGKQLENAEYKKMVENVEVHLREFNDAHSLDKVLKGRHTQFLGTSGTVTTLASLHLELPRYIRDKVDGAWMKAKDIKALSRRVAEMTPEERAAEPCIGAERADLVVAGCAILEAILGMWQVPSLRVADRGIREGILRGLMQLDQPVEHARNKQKIHKPNNGADKAANKVNKEYHG